MKASDEDAYRDYVVARMDRLRRVAFLLCRDWHLADDLVSVTITKLYRGWRQARAPTSTDAYVQRILTNTWLDELRRPWRREIPIDQVPEETHDDDHPVDERLPLLDLLATLTPRRRAAVVLRFYCDLSVEETADVLGCGTGTVKSLTARGLHSLQVRLAARHASDERR